MAASKKRTRRPGQSKAGQSKPGQSKPGNPVSRSGASTLKNSGQPTARPVKRTGPAASAKPPAPRPRTVASVPAAESALEVLPPDGAEYPSILRGDSFTIGRSVLGVVFALSLFFLLPQVVSRALVTLFWALTANDQSYATYFEQAFAFSRPLGMLSVNLGLATLIPIAWGLVMVIHRVRPRWLSSVQPRIRWRYIWGCVAIAIITLNGALLLSNTFGDQALVLGIQPGFWAFLPVIILTSPLQALAEEVLFRGYLMQALGSLVRAPWFGVVVSSVVFALLHGTQNPALFVDRLAFGLLAAILVWRTGGLEAGIAAHAVNNVCAYLIAGLTSSIAVLKQIKQITWVDASFDVGGFAVFGLGAYGLSRLMKLRTTVDLSAAR